jgi:predicted metal-dependent hydrolase
MQGQLQLFESTRGESTWHVRVSRRARRLSVRVYPGGRVEVVVPPGASPATVQRFVGTHRRWIEDRVTDLSAKSAATETRPELLDLKAIGRRFAVEYRHGQSARPRVHLKGEGWLDVVGRLDSDRAVAQSLRQWLSAVAQEELGKELRAIAAAAGFQFERVQVRRQRTRWGSCSASGTISLNVCLLFLDPAVTRYLLIHELCHTRHMNHSRRFWNLVESLEPNYRTLDRELLRGWQRVPAWMFA